MEELLADIASNFDREYLNMVNAQGAISGRNNWDFVFRSFTIRKLAEFELRLIALETEKQTNG